MEFKKYRRKQLSEMREWVPGDDMTGIMVSDVDKANGSPASGDMIARNPENHDDQWLVALKFFDANYEECK
jgi:hypothetical protein